MIVAAGSEVNTEIAESSGLEIDPELGGILVNSELSARSNVYAVGIFKFELFSATNMQLICIVFRPAIVLAFTTFS